MITGRYFDGRSAAGVDAQIQFGEDGNVHVHGAAVPISAPFGNVTISDRVGNITRRITFPDGGVFETQDNDAIDAATLARGVKRGASIVHWLEARWPIAIGSLVAVAVVSFGFIHWGVPALASWAAEVMPPEADKAIGAGTLDMLDRVAFEPSELPEERQRQLRRRFDGMTRSINDGHVYQLEFRHGGVIDANAFALPSGIIVMTDELVALSKSDDELVSVLAHEIGHVRGRHALRQMLQAAGVSSLAVALLGDVSALSGVLAAAPALLTAKYSRDFETEADAFAKKWMKENGIAESNFDAILCRLGGAHGEPKDGDEFDYFSSHPSTNKRARCTEEPEEAKTGDDEPQEDNAPDDSSGMDSSSAEDSPRIEDAVSGEDASSVEQSRPVETVPATDEPPP